jgi:regulator of protease activity HflC (stomatin/prohibitin superfamily)
MYYEARPKGPTGPSLGQVITGFGLIIFVLTLIILLPQSWYVVQPGHSAIHLRLGKIIREEREPGYYFKLPFIDSVNSIDLRIRKASKDIETMAMSKDLQPVSMGIVLNYRVQDARRIFEEIGTKFEEIIIDPFTQESVKAIVAKFTAEDLIQRRHEAKDMVIRELGDRMASKHLQLVDFNFTHLDFSREFIKAVEDKQIAEQQAKTAKNLTEKVKEEAVQMRTRAEAEAYSLKLKKESITGDLVKLQEIEARVKAIEKWDGHMPKVTGGSTPFITTDMHL